MEYSPCGALYVWLTAQDTVRMGLGEAPVWTDGSARGALRQILHSAREKTDFRATGGLTLEVLGTGNGYLLIFTAAPADAGKPPRTEGPAAYWLPDSDSLLQLAGGLPGLTGLPYASLYRAERGFFLLIYGRAPVLQQLLCETAVAAGTGDTVAAHIEEYGRACCIGDALTRLQKCYSF